MHEYQPGIYVRSGIDGLAAAKEEEHSLKCDCEEFYNTCHGPGGKFCPTSGGRSGGVSGKSIKETVKKAAKEQIAVEKKNVGKNLLTSIVDDLATGRSRGAEGKTLAEKIEKIGLLGPTSRFRQRDIKQLTTPQLRRLHAHLETNSRKWGAAVSGLGIISGLAGIVVGIPALGLVTNSVAAAYLTRTRERFAVGQEAQRRGIHLKFNNNEDLLEFATKEEKFITAVRPGVENMSPAEIIEAIQEGLQGVQDLLKDPEEKLTVNERKTLKEAKSSFKQALRSMKK